MQIRERCGQKKSGDEQVVIYSNADDEAVEVMKTALDENGYKDQYIFQTFGTSELGGKLLAEGSDIEADGCFAPVQAFVEVFKHFGIEPIMEEVREPMRMLKKDHIRTMLQMERISSLWEIKYRRKWIRAGCMVQSGCSRRYRIGYQGRKKCGSLYRRRDRWKL